MALAPCRECGQQVSTEATACPHCGFPIHKDHVPVGDQYRESKTSENEPPSNSDPNLRKWLLLGAAAALALTGAAVFALVMLVGAGQRGNTAQLYWLKENAFLCDTRSEPERMSYLFATGDYEAFSNAIGKAIESGCPTSDSSLQVYAVPREVRAAGGRGGQVLRVRPRGQTEHVWIFADELVSPIP